MARHRQAEASVSVTVIILCIITDVELYPTTSAVLPTAAASVTTEETKVYSNAYFFPWTTVKPPLSAVEASVSDSISFTPSGTMDDRVQCWHQLNQVYNTNLPEGSSMPYQVRECSQCCDDAKITAKYQDWLLLSSCQSVKCLRNLTNMQERVVQDIFWLTSNTAEVFVYMGDSTEVILTWDYLSSWQKLLEVIFVVIVLAALIITLVGNTLVIATLLSRSQRHNPWWIFRAFLAASDLLKGTFVIAFALHNSFSLMTTGLSLSEPATTLPFPGSIYEPLLVSGSYYANFSAFVFEMTAITSSQCLAWLTFERLLICKYPRVRKFLTPRLIKGGVLVMWISGLSFPLLLFICEGSWNLGFFDPLTKLTILLPGESGFTGSQVVYWLMILHLLALYLFTVIASVLAIGNFAIQSREEVAELVQYSPSSQTRQQEKEDRRILTTMKLMLGTSLVSTTPRFLLLVPEIKNNVRVIYFSFWWVFVLGSCWNWYIYNLRSDFFRDHLARLLLKGPWLPEAMKVRLHAMLLPSAADNLDWGGPVWHELDAHIRKKGNSRSSFSNEESSTN